MALRYEHKMIGPDEADRLLCTQPVNRPVNFSRVLGFANEMRTGNWHDNGEPIIISVSGKLLDGQHRLYGVRESGCIIPFSITYGVEDSSFKTIDTGRTRSVPDVVALAGVPYAQGASAAAGNIWRLWHDLPARTACPAHVALGVIQRFPSLLKWAPFTQTPGALPGGATLLALVYLEDIAMKPRLAERFFRAMSKGDDLSEGDPLLALRNRVLTARMHGARMTIKRVWEGVARALDALENDETLMRLQLPPNEAIYLRRPANWDKHLLVLPMSHRLDAQEFLPPDDSRSSRRSSDFQAFVHEVRETAEEATGVKANLIGKGTSLRKGGAAYEKRRDEGIAAKITREARA